MQPAERNVAAADLLRFVIYFEKLSRQNEIEMLNEAQQINREISERRNKKALR
jgi:hypothetical protein